MAYVVYFVEDYLVYFEMFIPKITAGIFEESDRGSHTCPFDPTQTTSAIRYRSRQVRCPRVKPLASTKVPQSEAIK
jgi:hypothetical protein